MTTKYTENIETSKRAYFEASIIYNTIARNLAAMHGSFPKIDYNYFLLNYSQISLFVDTFNVV